MGVPVVVSATQAASSPWRIPILDLHSQVGVGTTVKVRFPAERIVASLDKVDSLGVEHRAAS